MSNLVSNLAQFVREKIATSISSAPEDALRVVFSAPPMRYVSDLFDALTSENGCLLIDTMEGIVKVPVYLVDQSADDPHKSLMAARCTPSYLVTIRNSDYPVWLALQEVGAIIPRTLITAVNPLGISKEITSFQAWLESPVIVYLLNKCRIAAGFDGGSEQQSKNVEDALLYALNRAWTVDERYKDKRTVWKLLENLLDDSLDGGEPFERFILKLGLPCCKKSQVGSAAHLKTLERVSDLFSSIGLGTGFSALEANADTDQDLVSSLQQLRQHVEDQRIDEAGEFANNTLQIYSPIADGATSIPEWWSRLDVDAWTHILDSDQPPSPEKNVLSAKIENTFVAVPKGLLPLVTGSVKLEISNSGDIPINYLVERSNGAAALAEMERNCVQSGQQSEYFDDDIPAHERFIRYKISAEGYEPITLKVIVLDSYGPGVVAFSPGSAKASPFKLNKKATDAANKKVSRYECDLTLPGMGSHNVDLYVSKDIEISEVIKGYEVDAEQEGALERRISKTDSNHYSCLIETDEECYYEFDARSPTMDTAVPFRVYIEAEEVRQVGADSEFDRLVLQNLASANGDHSSPRVDPSMCRLMDLEVWALDSDDSYYPLVLGPDYRESWQKPCWSESPKFSSYKMLLDPRPDFTEVVVPAAFTAARAAVLADLRTPPEELTPNAATLQLHTNMRGKGFSEAVQALLDAYCDWLDVDYDVAVWADLVCIHSRQSNAKALESAPYAILLSPFHPIRLAWQFCAQSVLQDALEKHARCPAASVMNPASFPDCLILPCKTATGGFDRKPFAAMASSSDYWGVMLSVESNDLHQLKTDNNVFDDELGISIDGLSSGFSEQQVVRSLDEVSRLMSAKSTLHVGISSDEGGSTSCNDGIDAWCTANLGLEEDEWQEAGPRSVVISDSRSPSLHPEQAMLASLTARTDAAVRWFTGRTAQDSHQNDLSIIAHLSTMSQEFDVQNIRSAIDISGLSRWRIRKQLPTGNAAFIAESRIGEIPSTVEKESVEGRLLKCVDKIERQCREKFDSYIFAPDMANLNEVVSQSRYTALSSTDVDAACFFGSTEQAYLWDYELPSYSRRAGENSGYYLLAKESPGMMQAVRSALGLLGNNSQVSDDYISSLLKEISRRGMPTLKRLSTGGSMSLGEIGMLTALRVLQAEFEEDEELFGLLPTLGGDETLNLVVSADPFQKHFDDLRMALGHKNGERPDLLVLSLKFSSDEPVQMRLTPIEVKARGGSMSKTERVSALGQASNFADFLIAVQGRAGEVALWGIAWRNLLATILDYGFRVYGQLNAFMNHADWARKHSSVLKAIATVELDIEVDQRGRLIVIDSSGSAAQQDLDSDDFEETICLSHEEAFSVLARSDSAITNKINDSLGDWQLKSVQREEDIIEVPPPPPIPDTGSLVEVPPNVPEEPVLPIKESEPISPLPEAEGQPEAPAEDVELDSSLDETTDAPVDPKGIKFKVGSTINQFSSEELYFYPGNTALEHLNIGVVGDLGTGKTQLIQALVRQFVASPENNRGKRPNILIFDYKRDYSKPDFVKATGAKVVSPFDIPLNMFDVRDSAQGKRAWLERTKFFIDVMDKIYSGIGPVQRTRIKSAVKDAYASIASAGKVAPTIGDVFESYKKDGATIDTPYNIMDDLVDGEYFVSDSSDVIPFSEFLDGVVVLDLAKVGQDDRTKNMLVVIFLNLFYEHMLRIEKKEFLGEDPKLRYIDTMLLVDEADNIMRYEFEVLKKILLQGREFGVGVLLASQYLSHFKTAHENYVEPLLSWFMHKVPNVTVKELEGLGLTNVNSDIVDTIKSLECHQCLFKTLKVDGKVLRGTPFFELMQ